MVLDRSALRFLLASALGCLALLATGVQAVTVNDLYEVTLPIQGNREAAFGEALKAVAVRVSGRRDASSVLESSAASARKYVQRFSFTADNQLQVAFDVGSVDRLLDGAGLPIWGRERPATLVALSLPMPDGTTMWLDASYPAVERDMLLQAAKQRGVPLVFSHFDSNDRSVLSTASSAVDASTLAARHNANAVLLGQARRDSGGQLNVTWSLAYDDGMAEVTGTLEDGAHLIADTFSRIYAVAAGSLDAIVVEVSGIRSLDDYASATSYLEGMTLVRSVAVEQVAGDTLRFRVSVRGNATTLRRALALDNKLVPLGDDSEPATGRLQLRLQR